jgi:signal transduction histidine kinase
MNQSLKTRLAFLDLGPADKERLDALRPLFEERADEVVEAFYAHLLSFSETRAFLTDSSVRDKLLLAQRAYLLSLCDAELDEDYVRDRKDIGRAHVRVGLVPRWYFGAYSLYYSILAPAIFDFYGGSSEKTELVLISLQKILMLDAQLAMEAYVEGREQNLGALAETLVQSEQGLARQIDEQRVELQKTTERARAAERLASVGAIAAGLAHEIGTPMGIIRGHAELLEDFVDGEDGQSRLEIIVEQIDRISNIMQGLLNLARPAEVNREVVELGALLDAVLSFIASKAERQGIEVVRRYDEVPELRGDTDRLQQLFLNLILNAFDAMEEGGRLEVGISRSGPRHVSVRILDDGVGISPADLRLIFDPFFTTKRAGQGSGLGLVVAQEIARDHGGEIEASSVLRVGTEFSILLPL